MNRLEIQMRSKAFISAIKNMKFENTFNPYFDTCKVYDYSNSANKRISMLEDLLEKATQVEIDAIWVGRDLGHRGGRRTGLALTDDFNLSNHLNRWSLSSEKLTKGQPIKERTASVVWEMLNDIKSPVFLWNVFPLHPFKPGEPFTNRNHNSVERKAGEEILSQLIDLLKPKRLIAIGNDAENSVIKFSKSYEVQKARHPSYGGQNDFVEKIKFLYKIE